MGYKNTKGDRNRGWLIKYSEYVLLEVLVVRWRFANARCRCMEWTEKINQICSNLGVSLVSRGGMLMTTSGPGELLLFYFYRPMTCFLEKMRDGGRRC